MVIVTISFLFFLFFFFRTVTCHKIYCLLKIISFPNNLTKLQRFLELPCETLDWSELQVTQVKHTCVPWYHYLLDRDLFLFCRVCILSRWRTCLCSGSILKTLITSVCHQGFPCIQHTWRLVPSDMCYPLKQTSYSKRMAIFGRKESHLFFI